MPPSRPGRLARQQLTRTGLVLAPQRGAGASWVAGLLLALAMFALGAGAGWWYRQQRPAPDAGAGAQAQAEAQVQRQQLQQQLEQARLGLRMQAAQTAELQRQIDTLNQRLRQCQEDLTFFRKTPGSNPR